MQSETSVVSMSFRSKPVMAWLQKDKPEHVLMLASLLIGLKMGWPGSFHPFFNTLR